MCAIQQIYQPTIYLGATIIIITRSGVDADHAAAADDEENISECCDLFRQCQDEEFK